MQKHMEKTTLREKGNCRKAVEGEILAELK